VKKKTFSLFLSFYLSHDGVHIKNVGAFVGYEKKRNKIKREG
jgi:hypothetical protein